MKVLDPITFNIGTMLVSSTATNAYADYDNAETYDENDVVTYNGRYWIAFTTILPGFPPKNEYPWGDLGPSNREAMFDSSPTSKTAQAAALIVVVAPGAIDSVAFLNISGDSLYLTGEDGASVVYSKTIDVDGINEVVLTDLPALAGLELTIHLAVTAGNASIGGLVFGTVHSVGATQAGANAGIIDYSTKQTDTYGDTIFVQRGFAKTLSVETLIKRADLNGAMRLLSGLRARPTVWIASDSPDFAAAGVVYGYYRDFQIDVRYPTYAVCSLEIEGLV